MKTSGARDGLAPIPDAETLRTLRGTWRESGASAEPRWGEHWTFTIESDTVEAFIDGSPGDGYIYVLTGTLAPARAGHAAGGVSLAGAGYKPGTPLLREVRCEIFGPFEDTLVVRRAAAETADVSESDGERREGRGEGTRGAPTRLPDTVLHRATRAPDQPS